MTPSPGSARYDEYNDFARTLRRYSSARSKLESLGVRIAPNSRLRNAESRLAGLPPDPKTPIPRAVADQLLFDLREIDEIILIGESFAEAPTPEEAALLRLLPGGTDNPDDDLVGRSRDAQFELFLRAAILRGGGRVRVGSPDLLLLDPRGELPIEAKRPTSLARLDDRLHGAVRQLARASAPGIVAMSLDHVIRPPGGILGVTTAGELNGSVGRLMSDFLQQNVRDRARRLQGRNVAGLLLMFRTPARALDTNLSLIGTSIHVDGAVDPAGPDAWRIGAVYDILSRSDV